MLKKREFSETEKMLKIARGEEIGELVLKNCRLIDVFQKKADITNISIYDDTIVGVGKNYSGKKEIDCKGKYLSPGLIDSHIHIESSHLLPEEFSRIAIKHGTTTVVTDPHEIANATGSDGIKFFIENGKKSDIDIFFMIPSCVPAINFWDTYKNEISAKEIETLLKEEQVIGLAEMMNFPGVINGFKDVWDKLFVANNKIKDGHSPLLTGESLNAYLLGDITSDHECIEKNEALEKISKGMTVMIRQGSAAKNLYLLKEIYSDSLVDRITLVSDDLLASDLINNGHIDRILREAIKNYNIDPFSLIRFVTINPAVYYNFRDRGLIAPGKKADMVIFEDLKEFNVNMTIKDGKVVYNSETNNVWRGTKTGIPQKIKNTVKIKEFLKEDFIYKCKNDTVKIIDIIENQIITKEIEIVPKKEENNIIADIENDTAKIAVIDRYTGESSIGIGLVKGLGLKKGAIASSYAHDTHNIIVAGMNDEDMALAVNKIKNMQGGMTVISNGKELASLEFDIGGVVSSSPAEEVAEGIEKLNIAAKELGTELKDIFVTLSFMALTVIPEIKITPVGLVNLSKNIKYDC